MTVETLTILFLSLLSGMFAAAVAWTKHRSALAYGILGILFPLFGVIVALIVTKLETTAERHERIRAEYQELLRETTQPTRLGRLYERAAPQP